MWRSGKLVLECHRSLTQDQKIIIIRKLVLPNREKEFSND